MAPFSGLDQQFDQFRLYGLLLLFHYFPSGNDNYMTWENIRLNQSE